MVKILVIRFSSIGDIVLTAPVIRCIKKQLPDAEIHFLTKPQFATLLEHNPYISQIQVLDKPLWKKSIELKSLGFDVIIDLHHNLRTLIIKSILGIPAFSFDKLNLEKWLMVKTKINTLPSKHIVERYLETTQYLGVVNDKEGLDYFFPDTISSPVSLPEHFIAFAIGAQHATKRLPQEKISEICKRINKPVVLLGGKDDFDRAEIIASSNHHVINLCGSLSIHESAYVITQAEKLITHDTGLLHIAAALKKETISIWGNTIPEFGMTAYYGKYVVKNSIFEVNDVDCRPCSKIGYQHCPKAHFNCMMMQNEQIIAETALS